MADEAQVARERGEDGAMPAAAALALGAAKPETADEFLREQTAYVRLQAEELRRELHLRHWSLRVHHISGLMKLAFEIGLAFIVLAIAAAFGAAIWSASRADGIVVDAFSVPRKFAEAGIAGDVLADDLTNRIALVRNTANGISFIRSKNVRENREENIKVEIPDTGISLQQVWQVLREWLGNERHLRGNLRMTGAGKVALTVALDGEDAMTFAGTPGDLGRLEQQAAEAVYARVDPVNYIIYLSDTGRQAEALALAGQRAQQANGPHERASAYSLWANETRHAGDDALSLKRALLSVSLNPAVVFAHYEAMLDEQQLGYRAAALVQANEILGLRAGDQPASLQGDAFTGMVEYAALERDTDSGDFLHALSDGCPFCTLSQELLSRAEFAARLHDVGGSRALIGQALAAGAAPTADSMHARYFSDMAAGEWRAAEADARALGPALAVTLSWVADLLSRTEVAPLLALAEARAGDAAGAQKTLADTPLDCYDCLRARGEVAALQKGWQAASEWFGRAIAAAPSIPFAYADWGAMLLHKGDYDGAIAKFEQAHAKGPHFADPLELWGEALMQQNRSDLALAKFEEANKYAPNWDRLHLEWGKALTYLGRSAEARKQFAIASHLDLSAADAAALARWRARHG